MTDIFVLIIQVFAFILLHILPAPLLERWLELLLSRGRYRFVAVFSGRIALLVIALQLRKTARSSVALLPDYLCNVVERAFTVAGWEIVSYRTNEVLEADWHELLDIIDRQQVGVLVGASIFGSSGLLDFLSDAPKQNELRKRNVHVVVDLSQDIRLIDKLPLSCSDFVHAIVSFNDKSFLGAMGGGILSEWKDFDPLSLRSPHEAKQLYFWFFAKIRYILRRNLSLMIRNLVKLPSNRGYIDIRRYDYSCCTYYPYQIELLKPIKLQLVLAIIGVYSLPYLERKKKKFLGYNLHLPTRFAEHAAYLIIDTTKTSEFPVRGTFKGRKIKPPYAIERDPNVSLRPYDIIVYNRGFDDEG